MTIINGWKITFGSFIGSTYAFNRLAEVFESEFKLCLKMDDRGNLFFNIEDEEKTTEADVKNMYYFIKGYCISNKTTHFHPSHLFK